MRLIGLIKPIGKSFIKEEESEPFTMAEWQFQELKESVIQDIFQRHIRWHGIRKALMSGTYDKIIPPLTPEQLQEVEQVVKYHYEQLRMALGELA